MIFNSLVFIIFAILFFSLWPWIKGLRNIKYFYITVASFIFYGWWDWRFLFLIIFSGLIDYFAAIAIESFPKYRKTFFGLSLLGNLGTLAIFKYSEFFITSVNSILSSAGASFSLSLNLPTFFLILPVGISFYTF